MPVAKPTPIKLLLEVPTMLNNPGAADKITPTEKTGAILAAHAAWGDQCRIEGFYVAECFDKYGKLKWRDVFANTVVTVGKNSMLDNFLAGSAFTQTGPYMGLIGSSGYSAISAADTMASHGGWTEATSYSGSRKTCAWSAASAGSKALSSALSFSVTGTDTYKGCFTVLGSGASATVSNTSGTLFSAGLFTGGDRSVLNGDTVNVSYSAGI